MQSTALFQYLVGMKSINFAGIEQENSWLVASNRFVEVLSRLVEMHKRLANKLQAVVHMMLLIWYFPNDLSHLVIWPLNGFDDSYLLDNHYQRVCRSQDSQVVRVQLVVLALALAQMVHRSLDRLLAQNDSQGLYSDLKVVQNDLVVPHRDQSFHMDSREKGHAMEAWYVSSRYASVVA